MMDQKQREKCLKEVGLLKELNHPHIIRFLDSFLSEKDMHIILEWASRGDLKGNGYDMKSDVWSLGCVFYELCVRRSPFKHPEKQMSLYDLFLTISKGQYDPLPEGFSVDLRKTVDGMLTLEVEKRMSMEEVHQVCEKMT